MMGVYALEGHLVAIAGLLALVCVSVLLARYSPAFVVASVLTLVMIAHRSVAAASLELTGPLFADQVDRFVGGAGYAVYLWGSFAVFLGAAALTFHTLTKPALFSQRRQPSAAQTGGLTLGDIVFGIGIGFLLGLYGDMFLRGVIPLFVGMERVEYAREHAGVLHLWLFEYGSLLMLLFGSLCVAGRIQVGRYDFRFIVLLVIVYCYCLLTGHRFSAFYAFGSFFVLPFAAVIVYKIQNPLIPLTGLQAWIMRPAIVGFAAALLVIVIVLALANSYIGIRFEDVGERWNSLYQRVFVQPVELWSISAARFFGAAGWDPVAAYHWMFSEPLDPTRNTGMQMLMVLVLGDARTLELLGHGTQYTGGFPESLYEWIGPFHGIVVVALLGVAYAVLLALMVRSIIQGYYLALFWQTYVYFALCIVLVGGMLNVVTVWTFWVKLGAMVLFSVLEPAWARWYGPMVPWQLVKGRAI